MRAAESPLGRREFVVLASCATAALVVSGCASLVTHTVQPSGGAVRLRLADYPDLAKSGGSLRIHPAGEPDALYVLRGPDVNGAATFFTVSPRCTHRGCTVEVEGANLVCPCHGSTYTRSGLVLKGPAEQALRSYTTTVDSDGTIAIQLGGPR
jgi:cytochrome b6-f complex iron-sulfur subunit